MDNLSRRMTNSLKANNVTVSTAESCTGGGVAKMLTEYGGASFYFKAGIVAYSAEMKTKLLGISSDFIAEHGVVSEAVARAMAKAIVDITGTHYGVSTTGIAGPGGETREHGVGVVFMCVYDGEKYEDFKLDVSEEGKIHDRAFIRDFAIRNAIQLLLNVVESNQRKEDEDGGE